MPKYFIKLLALFWLCAKGLSYPLWLSHNRVIPCIPVFDFLDECSAFLHMLLFSFSSILLLLMVLKPQKYLLLATVFIETASCLLDINRLQPWEYEYIIIAAMFFLFIKEPRHLKTMLLLLLASIYFYSGLNKLSASFLYSTWSDLILRNSLHLPEGLVKNTYVHYSGLLIGLLELGFALALLFKQTRKYAAAFFIAMHCIVILLLSPLFYNYNSIVWPWNGFMIASLFLLVFYSNEIEPQSHKSHKLSSMFFLFVFSISPIFYFIGVLDSYLAFDLYSGKKQYATFCIEGELEPSLLNSCEKGNKICKNEYAYELQLDKLSIKEMNVFVYPEIRVYKRIFQKFKRKHPKQTFKLITHEYPFKSEDYKVYE